MELEGVDEKMEDMATMLVTSSQEPCLYTAREPNEDVDRTVIRVPYTA